MGLWCDCQTKHDMLRCKNVGEVWRVLINCNERLKFFAGAVKCSSIVPSGETVDMWVLYKVFNHLSVMKRSKHEGCKITS